MPVSWARRMVVAVSAIVGFCFVDLGSWTKAFQLLWCVSLGQCCRVASFDVALDGGSP
jgi:hypothetical protein